MTRNSRRVLRGSRRVLRSDINVLGGSRMVLDGSRRVLDGSRRVIGGDINVLDGYRKVRDAFATGCSIGPRSMVGGAIAVLCVALSLVGCHRQTRASAGPGGTLSDDVLTPYLAIQEGLANDSIDGLATKAAGVAAAAEQLGPPASRVVTDARSLGAAANVAAARQSFGALSDALVSYAKAQRSALPSGVREAFCPMAQKPWLQRGSKISNPYYGKEMPDCGEFK